MNVSEEQYRLLFESNPQPMWVFELETLRFLAVNEAALGHYGYSRDEFMALTIKDIRPTDDVERPLDDLAIPTENFQAAGRWRHRKKDGTNMEVEITSHALTFAGRPARLVVATDITDRQRAEAALRNSEALHHSLVDVLPQSIFRKDLAGRFNFANKKFCELVGKTLNEIVGKTDLELYPPELAEKYREDDQRVMRTGKSLETVEEHRTQPGIKLFVRVVKTPLKDAQGQVIGLQGIFWDETERKHMEESLRENEELFRKLSESSPMGIAVMDTKGQCTYTNLRYRAVFGVTFMESLGQGWTRWIHPEDRPQVLVEWAAAIRQQHEYTGELRLQLRDAAVRWVALRSSIMLDDQGVFRGHAAIAEDITERKRAEDNLRKTTERLQILSRRLLDVQETERRAIARELHDEIGQALTATKINLQTALRFPDPAAVTQTLQDSIELVSGLLQQVRNLSLDLHAPMLDDLGLVAALRWYVDRQAQRAGLRAQFLNDPSVPRLDTAVETACFRVAQEAITNVIRHAGARTLAVELHRQIQALHLIVRDDGTGFDPADIQGRATEGFSLGWLSMQERTALVGGRLECESAPNQGTVVHGYFPLVLRASGANQRHAARKMGFPLKPQRHQNAPGLSPPT